MSKDNKVVIPGGGNGQEKQKDSSDKKDKEIMKELNKLTRDPEIKKIAFDIVKGGDEQDIKKAVDIATKDVQNLKKPVNFKELKEKNKGRKRVKARFVSGPAAGRTTSYWEDIAVIMEKRGEIEILGILKDDE